MSEQEARGAAVRSARLRSGLTLRRIAADLGVSVGTMSAIENGKVGLGIDRLQLIARRLGVPPAHLLDPAAVPPPSPESPVSPESATGWREFAPLDLDPVLGSAVEVFNETGYHGATMRVIATGAGISVPGMYHHYPSKQRLLVALVELALQELLGRVRAAGVQAPTPEQAFADMVEALALFHSRRAELARIVLTETRSLQEPDRSRLAGLQRQVVAALEDAAARAVESGRFAAHDLSTTIRAVTTMCLSLPYWLPDAGPEAPADPVALARRYSALAVDMMQAVPRDPVVRSS